MSFDSFTDFLAMGGHGIYVWLSYGMGLLIFSASLIQPISRKKSLIKELLQLQRRKKQTNADLENKLDNNETHQREGS